MKADFRFARFLVKRCLLGVSFVMFIAGHAYATAETSLESMTVQQQRKSVTGVVTDATGETIIGASVLEKGTTNGVITDLDGKFTLSVSADATIQISYIGYITQEIKPGNQTSLQVSLKEDSKTLDEVVVVGFGTQKKVNLTGSVATVKFSEQASRPITNVSSALSGLTSGVSVRQTSGDPGSDGATIRIRGLGTLNNSDPLILVDGIEAPIDAINPQDVESISILKDAASAAIYGSRAANGVILVTTKNGAKGKLNVTYNGRVSISSPTHVNESVSNYADYMEFMNEGFAQLNESPIFDANTTIKAWREAAKNPNGVDSKSGLPNYVAYPNTDWQEEFFNSQSRPMQEHNLSLSGGSDKIRFLTSVGYLDNPGLVIQTGMKKYSVRTNIEADVTSWLTLGNRFWANQQDKEIGDFNNSMTFLAQSSPGIYPNYNGVYGGVVANEDRGNNPYAFLLAKKGTNKSNRINETFFAKITPMKGLHYEFNFNYERRFDEKSTRTNGDMELVRHSDGMVTVPKKDPSQMITSEYRYSNYKYTIENLLRYNTTIKNHSIGALVGHQEYYYYQNGLYTDKKGLLDGNISTPGSAQEMVTITSLNGSDETVYDVATRSFFGRVNYGYKDRYLFEANLRYDASSKFNKDHRWGAFPSFSGAWRISEESFMEPLRNVVSNLKLRASWGRLGNTNGVGNYASQATYTVANYSIGGNQAQGVYVKTLSNPLITWESTAVTNIGIDAGLFNNRLTAELDIYERLTDGILYAKTLPLSIGDKTAPIENLAEVTNKGIELTLGWNDQIGKVRYSVSGNIGYNKNEVSKYKGKYEAGWVTAADGTKSWVTNLGDVTTGGTMRVAEGKMINEFYLKSVYKGSGNYFNTDGTVNINGGPRDGMIRTEDDMTWLKAMKAAGYYFAPRMNSANAVPSKTTIWYGDYIYADTNGDGTYGNSSDNVFRGESNSPKINYGLQMSASYKGFDFSMNWAGAGGFSLYWGPETGYNVPQVRHGVSIPKKIAYDHYFYDPANPSDPRTNINATYGRLINADTGYQNNYESDLYLFKGDYLKLKNVTVGYTLPSAITRKLYTQSVRVYVSGENLLTITDYPGVDPEMGAGTGYSIVRQIAFGLNVTF